MPLLSCTCYHTPTVRDLHATLSNFTTQHCAPTTTLPISTAQHHAPTTTHPTTSLHLWVLSSSKENPWVMNPLRETWGAEEVTRTGLDLTAPLMVLGTTVCLCIRGYGSMCVCMYRRAR